MFTNAIRILLSIFADLFRDLGANDTEIMSLDIRFLGQHRTKLE